MKDLCDPPRSSDLHPSGDFITFQILSRCAAAFIVSDWRGCVYIWSTLKHHPCSGGRWQNLPERRAGWASIPSVYKAMQVIKKMNSHLMEAKWVLRQLLLRKKQNKKVVENSVIKCWMDFKTNKQKNTRICKNDHFKHEYQPRISQCVHSKKKPLLKVTQGWPSIVRLSHQYEVKVAVVHVFINSVCPWDRHVIKLLD